MRNDKPALPQVNQEQLLSEEAFIQYCNVDYIGHRKLNINRDFLRAKDFYLRFKSVYPGIVKTWQTDNGAENLGEFDDALKADSIPHYFLYPHCPKIQTYIERYNMTIQEEFIDNNLDIINDKILLNQKLADYLI